MALGTLANLRAWLRVRLGHRNDTVLLGADGDDYSVVDIALDEALGAINQHYPLIGVGSFTTVADQQAYNPLPAGAWNIRKVFYGITEGDDNCGENFLPNAGEWIFEEILDNTTTRISMDPAIVVSLYRNRAALERYYTAGATIHENTVYLSPPPSDVRDVYFIYSQPRFDEVTDVTDDYEAAFRAYALYSAHSSLAGGQGAVTSVGTDTGVRISTKAAEHHLRMAEAEYKRFLGALPPLTPVRHWVA